MAEKKVTLKQTRSAIRCKKNQKATLSALGLGKIGRTAEHKWSPSVEGMVKRVSHLVQIEESA